MCGTRTLLQIMGRRVGRVTLSESEKFLLAIDAISALPLTDGTLHLPVVPYVETDRVPPVSAE